MSFPWPPLHSFLCSLTFLHFSSGALSKLANVERAVKWLAVSPARIQVLWEQSRGLSGPLLSPVPGREPATFCQYLNRKCVKECMGLRLWPCVAYILVVLYTSTYLQGGDGFRRRSSSEKGLIKAVTFQLVLGGRANISDGEKPTAKHEAGQAQPAE